MRVGVFTPLLSQLSAGGRFQEAEELQHRYRGTRHRQLSRRRRTASSPCSRTRRELKEFKKKLDDNGFQHQRAELPRQPAASRSRSARSTIRRSASKTIRLAEKLGVPVVIDFCGCPGDSPNAKYPNWVTCPWPPEYLEVLDWQWDKVVTPYWTKHGKFAEDHGVKIAIEMHPGLRGLQPGDDAQAARHRRQSHRLQLRSRATCSGRASTPSPPSACWATASSTCTPRTRRSTIATCR